MSVKKSFQVLLSSLVILVLAFSALPAQSAHAAPTPYYVSKLGSDIDSVCTGKSPLAAASAVLKACAFATIEKAVATAAADDTIEVIPVSSGDTFTITATITLNKAVHLIIDSGTVIKAGGALAAPLFLVTAGGVRISGAKLTYTAYPTINNPFNTSTHAIKVNAGISDLVIDNLKFDGANGAVAGTPGSAIYFASGTAQSNVQIVDNIFSGYPGTGNLAIVFNSVPTGVFDVNGNYFQNQVKPDIDILSLSSYTATFPQFTYNNWFVSPDTAYELVIYSYTTPIVRVATAWSSTESNIAKQSLVTENSTHAEIKIVPPEITTVISGNNISFDVMARGEGLTGLQFSMQYPSTKLIYMSADFTDSAFSQYTGAGTDHANIDTTVSNIITFHGLTKPLVVEGSLTSPAVLTWDDRWVKVATFTFKGDGETDSDASISLVTSPYNALFAMAPSNGPSNNIYGIVDSTSLDISVKAPTTTVTGTVSMQGRIARDGAIVTISIVGKDTVQATSIDQMVDNVSLSPVPYSTGYLVTITKLGYLDVNSDLEKHFDVSLNSKIIRTIELKGGDADGNDMVNVNDANLIGTDYGLPGHSDSDNFSDINSSGAVDIYDLALMGGNYDTDSVDAYGQGNDLWQPSPVNN